MNENNETGLKVLMKSFYEHGLKAAQNVHDLHALNDMLPEKPLIHQKTYINLYIDRAKEITEGKKKKSLMREARKEALRDFEKRLNDLQYRLTEVTTHHWTNKRKRQIRGIVPESFPELNVKKVTLAEVNKLERVAKAQQKKKGKKK